MTTLALALLDIAVRIGRWLIRRLGRWLKVHVVGYMKGKIDDFKRRLARAKADRRKAWLKGRISRWSRAVRWIDKQFAPEVRGLARDVCRLPEFKKLPEVARCERWVP